MTFFQTRGIPGAHERPHSPRQGSPDTIERAHCPQCTKDATVFRRRGGRLICESCWTAERAKDAACTCETYGRCEVCRPEPSFDDDPDEPYEPWWADDPMFDGSPHGATVPDHLATGYVQ